MITYSIAVQIRLSDNIYIHNLELSGVLLLIKTNMAFQNRLQIILFLLMK